MRKSFGSHQEVCHVWAQQNQEEGRASRIFFEKDKIYSYGKHFCMARILPSGVVVYGTHTYSSSTGTHQSHVRSAVSHREMVYCYDPDKGAASNRQQAEYAIENALKEARTERRVLPKTRIEARLRALREAQDFNAYLKALPEREQGVVKPFDLEPLQVSAEDRLALREYEQERDALRQARWAKNSEARAVVLAKAKLKESEKIAEWRANVYNHSLYNLPEMLRLSKDGTLVETSKGADIPVSHAKRLWPLIENCKAVGAPLTGRDVRLGHYTLNRIEANGDIVVGCHNIAYAEIEGIAKALGLLEENHA